MPRISLSQAINSGFINSLRAHTSPRSSNPLAAAFAGSSNASASISDSLRIGARVYGQAVLGINSVISALGISMGVLKDLSKITDKMIGLAQSATQTSIGSDGRANVDRQFQKLANDFLKIVENTGIGERNALSRDDLSELFKVIGLDETSADSIAAVFDKFEVFEADDDKFLASEHAQGGRPIPTPNSIYREQVAVGAGTFTNGQHHLFPTDVPSGVALGDANEDGNLDLLTSVYISGSGAAFAVGLGNGDGTFAAPDYNPSPAPADYSIDIRAVDLNNDRHLDVVVNERVGNGVSVALGNGDGSFDLPVFYATGAGSAASGIDVGDFDQDGYKDIVVADENSSLLSFFRNQGDGTFAAPTSFDPFAAVVPTSRPVAADFDADGKLDVMVISSTNGAAVMLGNGDGTFQAGIVSAAGTGPVDAVVGDVDNDGFIDIITSNNGSSDFTVLLGNGDGTFDAPIATAIGDNGAGIGIGDFNGDEVLDVVVNRNSLNQVAIHFGDGDGTFTAGPTYAVDSGPAGEIAVGDFTRDNVSDIAVPHFGGTNVVPLIGEATIGSRVVSARSSGTFSTLFESGRTLRSRPDAYALMHDLKGLKNQIEKNIKGIVNALEVVGENLDLVRETGLAMLSLSDTLSGNEEADEVARQLRKLVRNSASGALSQAENLQPIAVAALALDNS